jgi:hypothetical protein
MSACSANSSIGGRRLPLESARTRSAAIDEVGYTLIISIMQPYFFPYIGYFQLMAESDIFVVHDTVQYIKGGWINRNRILDRKGAAAWITLPVLAASHALEIRERQYAPEKDDAQQIVRRIENAYCRAPNLREVMPLIREIMNFDDSSVAAFNLALLKRVASRLGLGVQFVRASELPRTPGLKGQDRVIDVCKRLGATRYVNPIAGSVLYDANVFREHGLSLSFLETAVEPCSDKYPYLSIIHDLMTRSDPELSDLLTQYRVRWD